MAGAEGAAERGRRWEGKAATADVDPPRFAVEGIRQQGIGGRANDGSPCKTAWVRARKGRATEALGPGWWFMVDIGAVPMSWGDNGGDSVPIELPAVKILIVDDDKAICDYMQTLLEKDGYQVQTINDPTQVEEEVR